MILDSGIATFYHQENIAAYGAKPVMQAVQFHQGYYGELSYETNPDYPTERREDVKVDARVRVLQNRAITNYDLAMLQPVNGLATYYKVTRAYHGRDDDSGELISDISLTLTESWDRGATNDA